MASMEDRYRTAKNMPPAKKSTEKSTAKEPGTPAFTRAMKPATEALEADQTLLGAAVVHGAEALQRRADLEAQRNTAQIATAQQAATAQAEEAKLTPRQRKQRLLVRQGSAMGGM